MQVIKESTRALLLSTARKAFFEKGYEAVSMRELSERSGVSLSNIYNYFRSKEDLLGAVLAPLLRALDGLLVDHSDPENNSPNWFISEKYRKDTVNELVGIVVRYRQELKLLLSSSQNTRFQDYYDDWIDRSSQLGVAYMRGLSRGYPDVYTDISFEFMHFSSACWLMVMREAVQRDGLTRADVERLLEEFVEFCIGGWARLMRVDASRYESVGAVMEGV